MIDPDNEIEEWEEGNNEGHGSLEVRRQEFIEIGDSVSLEDPGENSTRLFRLDIEEQIDAALTIRLDFEDEYDDADLFVDFNVERPSSVPEDRFKRRCFSAHATMNEMCQFHPVRKGTYFIMVHAWGSYSDATLSVGIAELPAELFDLDVSVVDEVTSSQNAVIMRVAERYESMIGLGSYDARVWLEADGCAPGFPQLVEHYLDDIEVVIMVGSVDGEGGVVAMSGTCAIRHRIHDGWIGMPGIGAIVLDEADIEGLESDGVFETVVMREMAKAMGFDPVLWNIHGFLKNPSSANEPEADAHMNAALVVAAFNAAGGENYTGAKVPLENGTVPGVSNRTWRASVFGNEIMTPYLTGDTPPLSRITLEALYEVGYELDVTMADPFTLSGMRTAGLKAYPSIGLATYRGSVIPVLISRRPVK
ncbi:MAG: hypothetical protein OXL34_14165 [Gemmatimonadota bacterium]|nr:hypothetical protein [Gemmatimonadota bacterium]